MSDGLIKRIFQGLVVAYILLCLMLIKYSLDAVVFIHAPILYLLVFVIAEINPFVSVLR